MENPFGEALGKSQSIHCGAIRAMSSQTVQFPTAAGQEGPVESEAPAENATGVACGGPREQKVNRNAGRHAFLRAGWGRLSSGRPCQAT